MKKIVLIPDSFKGTLSAEQVCAVMEKAVRERFPQAEVVSIPVADGGEGSVDCLLRAMGGKKVRCRCEGPFGEPVESFFGMLKDGTAVIEMAACCGLPMTEGRADPGKTTTLGVGTLISEAVRAGAKKLIVCLGGSATNDGGCGAAAGLGVKFYNTAGEAFIPTGDTLTDIARIDAAGLRPALREIPIVTMCEITNPLYGRQGAAYVFAPQKGASPEQVVRLDAGLMHLSERIRTDLGQDVSSLPGGGAAGGMGAGMKAFFGSELRSGIETVLSLVRFEEQIADADLIFTGEGRIDSQSEGGKVLSGVGKAAKRQGKPVIALCGCDESNEGIYALGISAVFSINRKAEDFSVSRHKSAENLETTVRNILRIL